MEKVAVSNLEHNPQEGVKLSTLEIWDQLKSTTDAQEVVFDDIPDEDLIHSMTIHQRKQIDNYSGNYAVDEWDDDMNNYNITPNRNAPASPEALKSKATPSKKQVRMRERLADADENDTENNWRSLPDIPTFQELVSASVNLPKNIIFGGYNDFEQYISVHYKLLREDAISPLRESVLSYKKDPTRISSSAFVVYDNVRIVGQIIAPRSVVTKLSFTVRAQKRISWSRSRRLISGNIVLLSQDNFEHIRVGTVCSRPLSGLRKYPHEIDVFFHDLNFELDSRKKFVMIEATSGYWEAYKHVLTNLQKISEHRFPMKDYFVSCKPNSEIARYVQHNPLMRINSVLGSSQSLIDILEPFPSSEDYLLDKSQLKAYQSILSRKLALIQGPPGTGKTFVALKAIQTLLENSNSNVLPIVVACQTNHAVDQILLQLLREGASVIRLGRRTNVPEIKEVSVYEKIKSVRNTFSRFIKDFKKKKGRLMKQMLNIMSNFSSEYVTLTYLHSQGIITTAQLQSLVENSAWVDTVFDDDDSAEEKQIESWLGEMKIDLVTPKEIVHGTEEELQIEAEQLEELEQETKESLIDEDELHGVFVEFKRKFDFYEKVQLHSKEFKGFLAFENIWDIPEFSRGMVYKHWLQLAYENAESELRRLHRVYIKLDKEISSCHNKRVAALLRNANVVGMTTTGLNKYRHILESIRPKICFIEEAANILEGPVIPAVFPSLEQLILIGDHKQLRPSCSTFALAGPPFNLSISIFERLVENGMICDMLSIQRRMHPQIRQLVDSVYFGLSDHSVAKIRPTVPGMGQLRRYFFTHANFEETDGSSSKFNEFEAKMLVQFASYLILHGVNPLQITCLTFYGAQKKLIENLISKHLPDEKENMRVATVDGYQGEENDVILLSLVRNHDQRSVGFLVSTYRVCVALSRARRGIYMFGNAEMVANTNPLWWDVINTLTQDEELPGLGDYLPLEPKTGADEVYVYEPSDLFELNMKLRA
ncbi:helicase Required for RNAi-mediated heterochromatin assembly Hrr1 [Schizosaccharomyces octosporus yFS286]|uniref:Helicase Required for RNAi-mediated heterochromatin assembly Hrr1 n=1 Tax=Schizosaccharomyces octosporus (strain yFS286) TaxID=483514 RepID=S9R5H4_SCHOY|nr:helicase Required for RNAi-mediated heterochromatin assembly Hrr1 [Schizosaccharomyces octosporus yFS286]EPX73565.1 helicase Required for RNAi-mediated heterochromatin assembly Hrr1 [Schizosaccharomyces octosporus yFS286]